MSERRDSTVPGRDGRMKTRWRRSGQVYRWLAGTLLFAGISILAASQADAQLKVKTFTVQPCRVLDTRLAAPAGPIPGGTIRKVYVNVVAVGAEGDGHVTVFPEDLPNTASTLNFARGQTVANGVLMRICFPRRFAGVVCAGDLNIEMGPAAAHIVIDVTGFAYFLGSFF